jgi:hypothetical protein
LRGVPTLETGAGAKAAAEPIRERMEADFMVQESENEFTSLMKNWQSLVGSFKEAVRPVYC